MPWIESHSILIEHRKVREAAIILNIPPVYLIGHLHCLWHKVIELAEDGDITLWSEKDISYYARWDKDAKIFYEALKNRFIDEKNGFKLIHDWLDYSRKFLYLKYHTNNPKLLKYIYKKHNYKGIPLGIPKGIPKGYKKGALPNLTLPNLTLPNLTKDKHGQFLNVFLLPEEYLKLINLYGEDKTKTLIENLSTGIESKGYKYKSHYATILNWEKREQGKKPETNLERITRLMKE